MREIKPGDLIRFRDGVITGVVVNVFDGGRYYVAWADGTYSTAHLSDVVRV